MRQCVKRVWVLLPGRRSRLISSLPFFRAPVLDFRALAFSGNASRLFGPSNPAYHFQRFSISEKLSHSDPRDTLTEVEMNVSLGLVLSPVLAGVMVFGINRVISDQGKAEEL